MAVPIVETPKELKWFTNQYKQEFTKNQFKHFEKLITGLIVSENKTIQEINDCFGDRNQSSMNRFVNGSWDTNQINKNRISQIKNFTRLTPGIFISDPTLLHKTGKKMEKANYHYSGKTKKTEWGHLLVNNLFYNEKIHFPISSPIYLREQDADEQHPFKKTREIFLEEIDFAIKQKIPFWLVMADAGLYADYVLSRIKSLNLKYIIGNRTAGKISLNNYDKRISIGDYVNSLKPSDYKRFKIRKKKFYIHTKDVYTRGIGKEKLIITYKKGDEENKKIYNSNIFHLSDESLMHLLLKRWKVEELHRDEKQHLGLESYQVRKFGGIQRVVLAVLIAYTALILNTSRQLILHAFERRLETIGESCRYFRLIATKGWRWMKKKAKEGKSKLRNVLNRFVLVKNAKV
jgi:SRSO17 transposase